MSPLHSHLTTAAYPYPAQLCGAHRFCAHARVTFKPDRAAPPLPRESGIGTALYYTFNTLAQALAAAMALLAALAMYGLKGIDDECRSLELLLEQDSGGGTCRA
jgi:hypothetical protein